VNNRGRPTIPPRRCVHPGRPRDGKAEPTAQAKPFFLPGERVAFECTADEWFRLEGRAELTCGQAGMFNGVKPHCRAVYNDNLDDAFGRNRPGGVADDTWWANSMEGYKAAADQRRLGMEVPTS